MLNLAQRNLKIYFRQKSTVFFSLLSVFIIIGLYALFLGDVWKSGTEELKEVDNLMNSWIMAGIIAVTSITTTMGAYECMVEDRVRKNSKDFYSAPVKRSTILGGYLLSAGAAGIIMSLAALLLGEVYIVASGGEWLSLEAFIKMFGIILLSVSASGSMVFFIVSFFNSLSAFATASTVIGTLIGFLTGIYLPVGELSEPVQWVIKLFPVSHAGALARQVMTEKAMAVSFAGIPASFAENFKAMMGITYSYGDYTAGPVLHIGILLATAALFYFPALWNISRKRA